MHDGLLCHYSDHFRGAFKGGFAEGRTGSLHLEEDSPTTFTIFVEWLYQQQIVLPPPQADSLAEAKEERATTQDASAGDVDGYNEPSYFTSDINTSFDPQEPDRSPSPSSPTGVASDTYRTTL